MQLIREISPDTIQLLKRIYRQSRHHQVRQRAHCLLLHQEGFSIAQLLNILKVSRKTLYNWFNAWEEKSLVGFSNSKSAQQTTQRVGHYEPKQSVRILCLNAKHYR